MPRTRYAARSQERQRQRRGAVYRTPETWRAIEAAGGVSALAAELGLTPQSVSEWPRVPIDWLVDVEKITGIKRQHLRPDLKHLWA
jgi:DNA-binding transcriptional regulator YdaS (Cro superfamily)